jgi:imidazolonepropionase-like amidohydrolase
LISLRAASSTAFLVLLHPFMPAPPAGAQTRPVALIGATVLRVSGPVIPNGTVIIQNGKIKAVGVGIPIPPDARRIDLRGKTIMPGLIDANSSLFMANDELNTAGSPDRVALDGADFFDDTATKVLAHGVTTLYLSPSRRGTVTGVGTIVKLRPLSMNPTEGKPGYARVLTAQAAVKATLGVAANNRSSSLERLVSYEALRSTFKAAQQYAEMFKKYDKDLKQYETDQKQAAANPPADPLDDDPFSQFGGGGQTAPQKPVKPRKVPAQEVLVRALKREIPVRIEAYRANDIMSALRLADEFNLKIIIERGTEGYKVANEIARRKVPVIWGPAVSTGAPQLDTLNHWPGSAAAMAKAGIRLALITSGDEGLSSRFVLENAAAAAGNGLPQADALRAVTLGAAETLGIADRVGSLDPGKDADFVILSAAPWSASARIEQVWVDGEAAPRGK